MIQRRGELMRSRASRSEVKAKINEEKEQDRETQGDAEVRVRENTIERERSAGYLKRKGLSKSESRVAVPGQRAEEKVTAQAAIMRHYTSSRISPHGTLPILISHLIHDIPEFLNYLPVTQFIDL